MEKFYLGISLGFNSSACVFSSERGLVAAISQERLNGQKNTKELPFDAIRECIKLADTDIIDAIAISHYEEISLDYFKRYGERFELTGNTWEECILVYLISTLKVTVINQNITRVNHHTAHALSTFGFYGIPMRDYYTITSDGFGDGLSAQIKYGNTVLSEVSLVNSIALVYQFVTGALGFKEHQHEGKITGLAAFGKPIYLRDFEKMYLMVGEGNGLSFMEFQTLTDEEIEQVAKSHIIDFDKFLKLKKHVYKLVNKLTDEGAKREDIAASVQEFAEKWTCYWIRKNCIRKGANAYLAGGLFANVKINQRIKDLGIFDNVYVCPAMGDEGTSVGAAVYLHMQTDDIAEFTPHDAVLSGTNVGRISDIINNGYRVAKYNDDELIEYIAKNLAENKIICLKRGRMEFGPRALCHTSILYNCDTKETNTWLNEKLGRTEFMPFAPVTREEVARDLFKNLDGGWDSAKFMTMTFDCTDEFVRDYPAASHVDNTARPQIVSYDDDSFMWKILERYQELTGKKALINTSFNLHNNPIIESVDVAIRSWMKSDTDVLVIGNTVIEKA